MGAFDGQWEERDTTPAQPLAVTSVLGDPAPFPVEALSPKLRAAVEAVRDKAQVPPAIAAQSVLAAAALAAQAKINIMLPTGEERPVSLFLFTVAASGERKSSADEWALKPFRIREKEMRAEFERRMHDYQMDELAHTAAISAAKNSNKSKGRSAIKDALLACGKAPRMPPAPDLVIEDPTIAGIHRMMAESMPSLGLFSDEGAQFLGGWNFSEDNASATGGALSAFWDGKVIKRIRAGEANVIQRLAGRRLSVHLMVQPGVALSVFSNKGARDQGLMSRMLCAYPKTLRGTRLWQDASDATEAALEAYWQQLGVILGGGMEFADPDTRELKLDRMVLTNEARDDYIAFNDHVERQLGPGGKLEEVADIGSKLAQHAMRLAAVMAYFENGVDGKGRASHARAVDAGISSGSFAAGIALAQFYIGEALRLFNAGSVDEDSQNAGTILDFVRKKGLARVGMRWLSQSAPKPVRPALILKRAIDILEETGNFVRIKGGASIQHVEGGEEKHYRDAFTVMGEGD